MKIPFHNFNDVKMLTIEYGSLSYPESRFQQISLRYKIFKWFVMINVLLLLIFCGYALWSLYKLESALQSREEYVFDKYEKMDSSSVKHNVAELNDSNVVVSDFNEWSRSILKSLKTRVQEGQNTIGSDTKYTLNFFLQTIGNIAKNYIDPRENSAELNDGKVTITDLSDFEIRVLKEFSRSKALENSGNFKSRIARTTKDIVDESQCDVQFTFATVDRNSGKRLDIILKPAKNNEVSINVKNAIDGWTNNKSGLRECTFTITYQSK